MPELAEQLIYSFTYLLHYRTSSRAKKVYDYDQA